MRRLQGWIDRLEGYLYSSRSGLGLSLIAGGFLLIHLPYLDYVPIWDARSYFDNCLMPALSKGLDPLQYNCFGHTSMLYMSMVGLPQRLDPGSTVLLHLTNLAFGILAIVGFHLLLCRVLSRDRFGPEIWLGTLLFGLLPSFRANLFNLNLDYAVLVFFVVTLACMMAERWVLAAIAAVFMIFSKESGLILYGVLVLAHSIVFVTRGPGSVKEKIARIIRNHFGFAPILVFVLFMLGRLLTSEQLLWTPNQDRPPMLHMFTRFELFDPSFLSFLSGILVLSFNWILTLGVVTLVVRGAFRWLFALRDEAADTYDPKTRNFLLVAFVLGFLVLTRYETHSNNRYFLPLIPLMIALFLLALVEVVRRRDLRWAVLGTTAICFSLAGHASPDPISKKVYGTFEYGEHELYWMTSMDPPYLGSECCGYGRDQLVYNLEYTTFHYLQNLVYEHVRPTEDTWILIHRNAAFFITGRLDRDTYHRTLRREDSFRPRYSIPEILLQMPEAPRRFYYLSFPNIPDGQELAFLTQSYRVVEAAAFEHDGYRLLLYEFDGGPGGNPSIPPSDPEGAQ